MKIALYSAFAAIVLIASSQIPSAQAANPCKADREKFCPGMKPGDGKYGPCMKQHEAELSPECTDFRKNGREARKAFHMNCKADSEKLCAGTAAGGGALVKCLRSHESELGQSCAGALKALPGAKR